MPEYQDPVARDALRQMRDEIRRLNHRVDLLQSGNVIMGRAGIDIDEDMWPNPYEGQVVVGMDGLPRHYRQGAWFPFGACFMVDVTAEDELALAGNGRRWLPIPLDMDEGKLVAVAGFLTTADSGDDVVVMVHNDSEGVDMLTTAITIPQGERSSYASGTPPVIDVDNNDVDTGEWVRFDIDNAGTDSLGIKVALVFA